MSQLSNRDFYNELGKNILIYPFTPDNIKGASINLSVGDFAWDLNTKKLLYSFSDKQEKKFILPPFSIAAVATQEIIYVSKDICGTYHSKVGMLIRGFSNISTTLDPEYIGTSLISIQNSTSIQQELTVGEAFVTLMCSYLKSPALAGMIKRPNTPGQRERISSYEKGNLFLGKQRDEGYHDDPKNLKEVMNKSEVFIKWKKEFSSKDETIVNSENIKRKKKDTTASFLKILLYLVFWGIILLMCYGIIQTIENNTSWNYLKSYVPLIVIAVSVSFNDIVKRVVAFLEKKIDDWLNKQVA